MNRQPNFIMVVGEDTGRYFGCYGDPVATTPNVDRLAGQGRRFDQAYSTYPVCAPSRSTLVTGQYPMKIGTHQMRSTLLAPPRLFTHELRDAGYHVNWHTKLDFNFEPTAGWRDAEEDWVPALRAGGLKGRPFFLFTNLGVTHESSMWADDDPSHPPGAFRKGAQRPAALHDPRRAPVPPYLPDVPEVRGDIARHYDNLAALDEQVGRVLEALDASGQAENTIVLFLSDHGRGLPREKRWPYTAGIQMPLIVRWPGRIEPGSVERRLVSWVDVAPTILSLAGAAIPADYDGQPFLGPDAAPPRKYVFAGRDRMDESFDLVRVCRDERHHYQRNFFPKIPYAQRNSYMENMQSMKALRRLRAAGQLSGTAGLFMTGDRPAEELYDLASDPLCLHNVADRAEHAEALRRLRGELDAFVQRVDDKGLVPERELIRRGLVADRLDEYRARVESLPPEDRINGVSSVLETREAEAL